MISKSVNILSGIVQKQSAVSLWKRIFRCPVPLLILLIFRGKITMKIVKRQFAKSNNVQ